MGALLLLAMSCGCLQSAPGTLGRDRIGGNDAVANLPAGLVGPVWQWVQTQYNDDTKALPPRS